MPSDPLAPLMKRGFFLPLMRINGHVLRAGLMLSHETLAQITQGHSD